MPVLWRWANDRIYIFLWIMNSAPSDRRRSVLTKRPGPVCWHLSDHRDVFLREMCDRAWPFLGHQNNHASTSTWRLQMLVWTIWFTDSTDLWDVCFVCFCLSVSCLLCAEITLSCPPFFHTSDQTPMEQSVESTHLSLLQINYREQPTKGCRKTPKRKQPSCISSTGEIWCQQHKRYKSYTLNAL